MKHILIDDIYCNENEVNIISNINIDNLKLKSEEVCIDIDENKIYLKEIIKNNKLNLNKNRIYKLCSIDSDGNENEVLINNCNVVKKKYICKGLKIYDLEDIYEFNIYINKKSMLIVNINKIDNKINGPIDVKLDSIYVSNKVLNLQLLYTIYRIDTENNIKIESYSPQNVKIVLYDIDECKTFEFEAENIFDNKLTFAIDLCKLLDEKNYNLNMALVIDNKIVELNIEPNLEFKKVIIKNKDLIKYISILSDLDNNFKILSNFDLSIKPKIESISYENGLVISGKMNASLDIFSHDDTDSKIVILSKDGKIRHEYKMNVESDLFKVIINDEDLQMLKEDSIEQWNVYAKVYLNNEELDSAKITYKEKPFTEKTSLLSQSIDLEKETLELKIYTPKKSNSIAMTVKNNISVTKLISVVRRNNKLKVKFRTKENIEHILNKKLLNVNITTPRETLYQSKIKKNGKKTFTVEYNSKDGAQVADDMYKKGISIYIESDGKNSITTMSDIDKDIIYNTLWQRVQASKKYKKVVRSLYKSILSKLSIKKDWILYESFLGRNMSDSPKYIYQYLEENYPKKYKHIWVFNEIRDDLPNNIVQVKRFSFEHLYYIGRAKFWVNNMRQPKWFIKREDQVFLATWHGTPLKKLVFDMDEVHSANKNYKEDFYIQSRSWDYLISANKYSTEIFRRAFKFDNPILELGYPRNDLLYHPQKDEIAKKLKEKLGIPLDKKIVLYAPTWRDDEFFKPGKYKFNLELDLRRLRKELGDQYYFVLRMHYFIANHIDVEGLEDFVYNASKYDDVTELYLLSDVLITDYSSVFFDYANLNRPTLFFTYDMEKYRDTLRGFYLDLESEGPGPIVMNNDEIINELKDFNELNKKYYDRINKFHDRFCTWDDGEAAKRIAEEIIVSK